jgi:hypothetical protein
VPDGPPSPRDRYVIVIRTVFAAITRGIVRLIAPR